MPGLVKVGWTAGEPAERVKRLSSDTGAPVPFVVAWACEAESPAIERLAHDRLGWCRENKRREFFRCDVPTAIRAMEACNMPLGAVYRPQKRLRKAGEGGSDTISHPIGFAVLRAFCGAFLRHPTVACLAIEAVVAIYRPEPAPWLPHTAIRTALALEMVGLDRVAVRLAHVTPRRLARAVKPTKGVPDRFNAALDMYGRFLARPAQHFPTDDVEPNDVREDANVLAIDLAVDDEVPDRLSLGQRQACHDLVVGRAGLRSAS